MILNRSRFLTLSLAMLSFAGASFAADDPMKISGPKSFEFALIGDMPYGPTAGAVPTKTQVYPSPEYDNLIADINVKKEKVEFVIHVGDIKAGDTLCTEAVYANNLTLFNQFKMPVVFLPGDNEWTDCHRANNGGYDPIERLTLLRNTFYQTNETLGDMPMAILRQSSQPGFSLYRENVMWVHGQILFIGLHMPGSNNNRNRTTGPFQDGDAEYNARNAANIAWLNQGFNFAAANPEIAGIVVASQANPFERFLEPGQGYTVSGYQDFINTLRTRTIAFGKPVLLAGGDTHYFRIDKPLTETYPACASATPPCVAVAAAGARIENFTRLEVFAQTDVHWVKVTVDSKDPDVFSFTPQIVQANRKPH